MTTSIMTTDGQKMILERAYEAAPSRNSPTQFKLGASQATPTISDTDLTVPVPISGTEAVDACDATTGWSADTDSAVALNTTTFKEGTGSLSIAKSGTTGTTFGINKAVTSRDFTDKDVHTWLYFVDITDLVASGTAVSIRYGSDSSNYFQKDYAIGTFSNGWNLLLWDDGSADSTTGSPVLGSHDYYRIILNTDLAADTVAADRVLLDDLKVISADDYLKDQVASYPLVDETNLEVSHRLLVLSTEANGYPITGIGVFNDDATPLMVNVTQTDTFNKTDDFELIYVIRDRMI